MSLVSVILARLIAATLMLVALFIAGAAGHMAAKDVADSQSNTVGGLFMIAATIALAAFTILSMT
jgi:hypothetical protein